MKKLNLRLSDSMIGLLLIILFGVLTTVQFNLFETLELKSYDIRARLWGKTDAGKEISLIVIDDNSIDKMGAWPWPRNRFADIIDKLSDAGAKIIAFTVIFSEPEQNAGLKAVKNLKKRYEELGLNNSKQKENLEFHNSLTKFIDELDNDTKLVQAIQKARNVILPLNFQVDNEFQGKAKTNSDTLPQYISDQAYLSIGNTDLLSSANLPKVKKFIAPMRDFVTAARGIGYINIEADRDGVVRTKRLAMEYEKDYYPPLSVQIARCYNDLEMDDIRVMFGKGLRLGKTFISTDSNMKMLVSYNNPGRTFPYFSFHDVLNGKIDGSYFKNKIVIIGITTEGILNTLVTPTSNKLSIVEYEANLVQNLIHHNFIWRPSWIGIVEFVLLIFIGLLASLILPRFRIRWGITLCAAILLVIILGATVLFAEKNIWLKITTPSLLLILGYAVIQTRHFFVSSQSKEKIKKDTPETNKMLGISFQSQGMLEMALEKFKKCPVDESVKNLLYNLALEFEGKKQFNKAQEVYKYISNHDYQFKDVQARIQQIKYPERNIILDFKEKKPAKAEQETIVEESTTKHTLGRYEIIEELGKGAMGVVYKGVDPKIGRTVAIKTIRFDQDFETDQVEEMKDRFFSEAKAAGQLNHPNIITIYDTGEDYDLYWIAMEFLEGKNLEPYTKKDNLLPLMRVLEIISNVCDALEYAHQHGIVHRDIKPGNIMLLKNGEIKVTDFGIARITSASKTQTGIILGTPSYMSPEQVAGKKVDGRSDIFSLSVVFYELLTGEKPFKGESIATLMYQIANEIHPDPKLKNERIPDVCIKILNKGLEKNLDKRYQKASELGKHCRVIIKKIKQIKTARKQASRE